MTSFILSNNSGTVKLTIKTSQILTTQNKFNILDVSGTSKGPLDPANNHAENFFWSTFNKGASVKIDTLITFATTYGLNLTQITGNGSAAVQLVVLGSQS